LFKSIKEDIDTALRLDPSARNHLEVLLTYPGLHAVWGYRIAHALWRVKLKLLMR
jgi:serine O-acetyltransferase